MPTINRPASDILKQLKDKGVIRDDFTYDDQKVNVPSNLLKGIFKQIEEECKPRNGYVKDAHTSGVYHKHYDKYAL
jgi:hypothetical protein